MTVVEQMQTRTKDETSTPEVESSQCHQNPKASKAALSFGDTDHP